MSMAASINMSLETIVAVSAVSIVLANIGFWIQRTFSFPVTKAEDAPLESQCSDTVEMHVFGRHPGLTMPSGSPSSAKLMFFARATGVPHRFVTAEMSKAPKGKVPFIYHGGLPCLGDSQLIIRYLSNTFDLAKMAPSAAKKYPGASAFLAFDDLNPHDQAISTLVRLTCEGELYWSIVSTRWMGKTGMTETEETWYTKTIPLYFHAIPAFLQPILLPMIRASVARDAWAFGLARHAPRDQLFLAKRAITSISTILGDKPFMLGNFPSECDCIVFGCVGQLLLEANNWPNPLATYALTELPNLKNYLDRIMKIYFSDLKASDAVPPPSPDGGGVVVLRKAKGV